MPRRFRQLDSQSELLSALLERAVSLSSLCRHLEAGQSPRVLF
jgi:hypothetical protein